MESVDTIEAGFEEEPRFSLDGVTYSFNNGYSAVFLDIKNIPENNVSVQLEQVGDLIKPRYEHSVIAQDDGKYTHRYEFSAGGFSGDPTAPLIITVESQRVNKVLQQAGEPAGGGIIYEG